MTAEDQQDRALPLPEAAMRAAVLKAVLDQVKAAYDQARADVDEQLRQVHTALGVRTIDVRLPGVAAPVAQISLGETPIGVSVDEDRLLAYCEQEHPTEVQDVPAQRVVRPAWRKALLARLVVGPDGTVSDPGTGRVLDFATVRPAAAASTTMTFKSGGRTEIAAGHRAGRLSLPELMNELGS